jgi:hypothetical protein
MTSVPARSRLVLSTDAGDVPLRSLHEVDLVAGWAIPVIAPASVLRHGEGRLTLITPNGPVEVDAHLVADGGRLVLRAGKAAPGATVVVQQRRAHVREGVELCLRGAAVDRPSQDALTEAAIDGSTLSVSAGGLQARVESALDAPSGARLYLELELPGGQLVPCVVSVVELSGGLLRARFVDIAPVDRERLVRLVFAEQRIRLAERRLLRDRG